MNNTYVKKPIQIEAFQMTEERSVDRTDWPEWLVRAWDKSIGVEGSMWLESTPSRVLRIGTLEGAMVVSWNDYIICGVQGEIYPCKPDIFHASYDEVLP